MATAPIYTAEQTAELIAKYAGGRGATVDELALALGRSVRSIVAKLSREGVYAKSERVAKAAVSGGKDELVLTIELIAKVEMPSLNKMTRVDLQKLMDFIKREGQ